MLDFWTTTIILVVFTFVFILMDEYVAKPWRRRRLEKKALTDPEVRRALEIAKEVAARGLH